MSECNFTALYTLLVLFLLVLKYKGKGSKQKLAEVKKAEKGENRQKKGEQSVSGKKVSQLFQWKSTNLAMWHINVIIVI